MPQEKRRVVVAIATLAILFGQGFLLLFVRTLARVGPPNGMKAVLYVWLSALLILLPISFGVNLLWKLLSWRLFTGCWLSGWSVVYIVGLLSVLPRYKLDWSVPCFFMPGLGLLATGMLLLLRNNRFKS